MNPKKAEKLQKQLDEVICAFIDSNPNQADYLSASIRDLMDWARKEARYGREAEEDKEVRFIVLM